jgi:hypothetical protein
MTKFNEQHQTIAELTKELADLKAREKQWDAEKIDHLKKFETCIVDGFQHFIDQASADKFKQQASTAGRDAMSTVQNSIPLLISASASMRAKDSVYQQLQADYDKLSKFTESLLATVQQQALAQSQQQRLVSASYTSAPPPQQQPALAQDANFMQLLMNVQNMLSTPAPRHPPMHPQAHYQPRIQEPGDDNDTLVTASRTHASRNAGKRTATGVDTNAGWTLAPKISRIPAVTRAFFASPCGASDADVAHHHYQCTGEVPSAGPAFDPLNPLGAGTKAAGLVSASASHRSTGRVAQSKPRFDDEDDD